MFDDRLTEQRNPRSEKMDTLTPLELVELIQSEDRRVAEAVAAEHEQIARALEIIVEVFRAGGRLFYVGAGTSGRLGVLDAAEMPPTFGTDPDLVQGIIAGGYDALVRAREGAEDDPGAGARDLEARGVTRLDFVLGIATSGTTPYVHGALGRARELGARTGFLLCTPPSPELVARHDVVIAPLVGPELITGSTRMKAGTATKLVLNTLSTGAMVLTGKVWGNLMVDLRATCRKLEDRAVRILRATLDLGEPEAEALLERAGSSVKVAIVMHRGGVSEPEARRRLEAAGGRVAGAIEPGTGGEQP
jgi:N-acetylmuramic acid 6-phosphate etherase